MDFARDIGELRAEIRALQSLVERLMNLADEMIGMKGSHIEKFRNIEDDIQILFGKIKTNYEKLEGMQTADGEDMNSLRTELTQTKLIAESAIRRVNELEEHDKKGSDRRWQIATIILSAGLALLVAWLKGGG